MTLLLKILVVAVMGIALSGRTAMAADTVGAQCAGVFMDASGWTEAEKRLICQASNDVQDFFRYHGIAQKARIRIQLHAGEIDRRLPHIGSYSAHSKTIRMLRQRQAQGLGEDNRLFGLPMDEALYRSVVVHELAHAIADQNFAYDDPSLVVQEYVAYVAQLATLEPALRERILDGGLPAAYRDIDEMSCVYYAMDPSGFGIKAYRHFAALPDAGRFLRRLLSGVIRPADDEME